MWAVRYRSKSLSSGVGDLSLLLPALTFSLCVSVATAQPANGAVCPPAVDSVTFFFASAAGALADFERGGFEMILLETTEVVVMVDGAVSGFFLII
jgi:hypothetical protein